MKFKIHIAGHNALLNADQLEELLELLADCEHVAEEWIGNGKGDNGSNYKYLIRKCDFTRVTPAPVLREQVEAMRLVTKLWDDERSTNS
jgi:hypothetical protein